MSGGSCVRGMLYGIGVGPGDPELLTVKSIKAINHCDIIAVPDSGAKKRMALDIVREYVGEKPVLFLDLPMTRDMDKLQKSHGRAAAIICERLDMGENVGFLTLGDPTVYSTYGYLHKLISGQGYTAKIIPGVTSFCAAAAALGEPLCEGGEPLHIIPASYGYMEGALSLDGTKVLMKSGKKLRAAIGLLREKNLLAKASLAENVGMEGERLVRDLRRETESGYFSVIIVKGESD